MTEVSMEQVEAIVAEALKQAGNPSREELKNTVERLAIMVQKDRIEVQDLPLSILKNGWIGDGQSGHSTWQEAKANFERDFLLKKLAENDWNISRTASVIGMERTHLHRKLKAYDLKSPTMSGHPGDN